MKKIIVVSLLSLMLAVTAVGVADAQVMQRISPTNVAPGQTVTVTVTGTGLTPCTVAISGSGVTLGSCGVNPTADRATFQVSAAGAAAPGSRTLTVSMGEVIQGFSFNIGGIAAPERGIPTGITTAQGFIDALRTLTDWLFVVLVVISVVMIVLAGLQFITGAGDPTGVSMARTKLIWAAVGIGVALLARGLPEAIQNLFGV
ncbi:MAG: hypothetical protein AAB524_01530 [Patescibacteria group bacterium]